MKKIILSDKTKAIISSLSVPVVWGAAFAAYYYSNISALNVVGGVFGLGFMGAVIVGGFQRLQLFLQNRPHKIKSIVEEEVSWDDIVRLAEELPDKKAPEKSPANPDLKSACDSVKDASNKFAAMMAARAAKKLETANKPVEEPAAVSEPVTFRRDLDDAVLTVPTSSDRALPLGLVAKRVKGS